MAQVQTHTTSLAVWGITSPLVLGTHFTVKVGGKCSAGCNLAGQAVEIYDHTGTSVASGTLGGIPYSDAVDLYWTEVVLKAPAMQGAYVWEAKLSKPSLELPHEAASLKFGFSAAAQAQHTVTLVVVNQATKAPVAKAHVMLRPYSGTTDDQGVVTLTAAAGEYKLFITKGEYDTYETKVTVAGDATIEAEMIPALFREDYRGNLWKVEKKR